MTKHAFGTCYQNASRALVLAAHPSWNADQVEAAASREWEAAATNWLVQTIRTCIGIRPKARWGYYGLPKRGHDGGQANRPPWSDYAEKQLPIFEASRALYPSIYLHVEDTPEENEQMVRNLLNETLTLASHVERVTGRRPPVLPYAWEFYGDRGCCALLGDADLETSLALPKELGAQGVVIWGSLHMANATVQQEYWRYFKEKTGPLVMRIHGGKNAAPVSAPLKCDDHHHFHSQQKPSGRLYPASAIGIRGGSVGAPGGGTAKLPLPSKRFPQGGPYNTWEAAAFLCHRARLDIYLERDSNRRGAQSRAEVHKHNQRESA